MKINCSERIKRYYRDESFEQPNPGDKPCGAMRKILGRQLFKIRQEYNRTLERVSNDTGIPVGVIDILEVGCQGFNWLEIYKLLDYYKKNIKIELINRYSEEELEELRREKEEQTLLKEARQIVEKVRNIEAAEAELQQAAEKAKILLPAMPMATEGAAV